MSAEVPEQPGQDGQARRDESVRELIEGGARLEVTPEQIAAARAEMDQSLVRSRADIDRLAAPTGREIQVADITEHLLSKPDRPLTPLELEAAKLAVECYSYDQAYFYEAGDIRGPNAVWGVTSPPGGEANHAIESFFARAIPVRKLSYRARSASTIWRSNLGAVAKHVFSEGIEIPREHFDVSGMHYPLEEGVELSYLQEMVGNLALNAIREQEGFDDATPSKYQQAVNTLIYDMTNILGHGAPLAERHGPRAETKTNRQAWEINLRERAEQESQSS